MTATATETTNTETLGDADTSNNTRTHTPARTPTPAPEDAAGAAEPPASPGTASPGTASPGTGGFGDEAAALRCVSVAVDRSGPVGPLSYLVPDSLEVNVGDEVEVPFGARSATGVVICEGDNDLATKEVLGTSGRRSSPELVELAGRIADANFAPLSALTRRLAPNKAATLEQRAAFEAGELTYSAQLVHIDRPDLARRVVATRPGTDPADVAASAAWTLAQRHQVLVLCPSRAAVTAVLSRFGSGAARLDSSRGVNPAAFAAFADGSLRVAVATRTAALWPAAAPPAVVVLGDSHPGHVESAMPYTCAVTVAAQRSAAEGAPLVIVSETVPGPQAMGTRSRLVVAGEQRWPTMTLIDAGELPPEQRSLPGYASAAIRAAVRRGEHPLVIGDAKFGPWRCRRCSTIDDTLDSAVVAEPTDLCTAQRCRRCGNTTRRRAGWPPERVEAVFGPQVTHSVAADLAEHRDAHLVVLGDLDRWLRTARMDTHRTAAELVVRAARAAGRDGQVLAWSTDPGEPLWEALFDRRDLKAAARAVWNDAKDNQTAPFSHLVWVWTRRRHAPDTSRWPGKVWGPRLRNGEWEAVVSIPLGELDAMREPLDALRAGGKVRVKVE